jgi:hypothetical protein
MSLPPATARCVLHAEGAGGEAEEHQFFEEHVLEGSGGGDAGPLPAGFRASVARLGANVNDYLTGHVEVERAVRAAEREKREAAEKLARDERRMAKKAAVEKGKRERKEARRRQAEVEVGGDGGAAEATPSEDSVLPDAPDAADGDIEDGEHKGEPLSKRARTT